jgi:hypothetical protein
MGSPVREPERGRDETQRRISVGAFHLARSELTQREYAARNMRPSWEAIPARTRATVFPWKT